MCGITGIISTGNDFSAEIKRMTEIQKHRGPDNTGYFLNAKEGLFFGHNRLSIIDISKTSNQPFTSDDKRYILVFNGEIYNYLELKEQLKTKYSFKTDSDTEVLLASYIVWKENCLEKLTGMFAFAIYDNHEKKLFAARDRFGVKPFHYIFTNHCFAFASEIKAFWNAGIVEKTMNLKAWASYLVYATYATPSETFWENIKQLPGGHYLTYKEGRININKWYHFEQKVNKIIIPNDTKTIVEVLKEKLLKSIQLRLRADVNVGFNLSGGVDSSLLFSLISRFLDSNKTKAFTFYSNDERYDEIKWVKQIVKGTGFDWTQCLIAPKEIPSLAQFIQNIQDEPYAGIATLAYAKVFEIARKNNFIVLLDGGGMDEQIAGYDYYTNDSNALIQGSNSSPVRPDCLDSEFMQLANKQEYIKYFKDDIKNLQYRDIFYTKLPRDLRFNDRISMAYSTELREPFLDQELFEFIFALPMKWKIVDGQKKWIIRQIIKEFIDGEITEAPKRPIQTPQREWLSGELKPWVRDCVDKAIRNYPFLNKKKVEKELHYFFNGKNENSFYIWQWISLSLISEN